jgi:hypothetical protein
MQYRPSGCELTDPGRRGRGSAPTLACVTSPTVPRDTLDQLTAACDRRNVAFREVTSGQSAAGAPLALAPGDMLYRAGTSARASALERSLYRPDIVTFYSLPGGPHRPVSVSLGQFAQAGLSTPGSVEGVTADRDVLRDHVDRLGGLPVVVKVAGGSSGVGVMIADTMRGLFSLVDYLDAQGAPITLMEFVERAVHWRVIVVGGRTLAAYRNLPEPDDFRTYASTDCADYVVEVPARLAALAIRSLELLQVETGGVDILAAGRNRLYLLESNFPFYFANAYSVAGIDVAGPMLDHLLAKRRRVGSIPAGGSS